LTPNALSQSQRTVRFVSVGKIGVGSSALIASENLVLWYSNRYKLGIRAGLSSTFQDAIKFVTSQGRMKFVRPLYRLLFDSPEGKKLALETFQARRKNYHAIAAKMIAKDLKLSS